MTVTKSRQEITDENLERTLKMWKTVNPGLIKGQINTYWRTTNTEYHTGAQNEKTEMDETRFKFKRNDFTQYTEILSKERNMAKKNLM